jgi:hypothetical protein
MCKINDSRSLVNKAWNGHERRKIRRRAGDLKQCQICGVFFPWESCAPTCFECVHKLIIPHKITGKIVNIII